MSWRRVQNKDQHPQSTRKRNRFSYYNNYDDDEDPIGQPIESEMAVPVKVRREFGIGGARGKSLLLRSCKKKDGSDRSYSNDKDHHHTSSFLLSLQQQQQQQEEQHILLIKNSTQKQHYHGVGYKQQSLVVRPKSDSWNTKQDPVEDDHEEEEEDYHREVMDSCSSSNTSDDDANKYKHNFHASVRNWANNQDPTTKTTAAARLVLGIFEKGTTSVHEQQQKERYPGPCVPTDFNPHHVFTKEEEDQLHALLIPLFMDNVTTTTTTACTSGAMKNRDDTTKITDTISPPMVPQFTSVNTKSLTSVTNDLAIALNQRFSSCSTTTSTSIPEDVVTTTNDPTISKSKSCWQRKTYIFQPTHLLCKRFLLPTPKTIGKTTATSSAAAAEEALSLSKQQKHQQPLLFMTSSSSAKPIWNYYQENHDLITSSIQEKDGDIVNITSTARLPINLLQTIFEPSKDADDRLSSSNTLNHDSTTIHTNNDTLNQRQSPNEKQHKDIKVNSERTFMTTTTSTKVRNSRETLNQHQLPNEKEQKELKFTTENTFVNTSSISQALHKQKDKSGRSPTRSLTSNNKNIVSTSQDRKQSISSCNISTVESISSTSSYSNSRRRRKLRRREREETAERKRKHRSSRTSKNKKHEITGHDRMQSSSSSSSSGDSSSGESTTSTSSRNRRRHERRSKRRKREREEASERRRKHRNRKSKKKKMKSTTRK